MTQFEILNFIYITMNWFFDSDVREQEFYFTFLLCKVIPILELLAKQKIKVEQEENFAEIVIRLS